MGNLLVDERDVEFVLYEQLCVEDLCKTERYKDFTKQDFDMVIEEARKLAVMCYCLQGKKETEKAASMKMAR